MESIHWSASKQNLFSSQYHCWYRSRRIYTRNPFDFQTHFSRILDFDPILLTTIGYIQVVLLLNYYPRIVENSFWSRGCEWRSAFTCICKWKIAPREWKLLWSSRFWLAFQVWLLIFKPVVHVKSIYSANVCFVGWRNV